MKRSILVIDDEAGVCEMMIEFLGERGYFVVAANSPADGLLAFEKIRPQVIFLDVKMPGMDGIEVVKKIRKIDDNVSVVMITGVTDRRVAEEALVSGADDYVCKPLDLEYLVNSVLVRSALQPQGSS